MLVMIWDYDAFINLIMHFILTIHNVIGLLDVVIDENEKVDLQQKRERR